MRRKFIAIKIKMHSLYTYAHSRGVLHTVFHSGVNVSSSIAVDFFCPETKAVTSVIKQYNMHCIGSTSEFHCNIRVQRPMLIRQIRQLRSILYCHLQGHLWSLQYQIHLYYTIVYILSMTISGLATPYPIST